jgi:hypothetical protein
MGLSDVEERVAGADSELVFVAFLVDEGYVESGGEEG